MSQISQELKDYLMENLRLEVVKRRDVNFEGESGFSYSITLCLETTNISTIEID